MEPGAKIGDMAGKRATYADIEALPENKVGELIDGELFVSPRPALPHQNAAKAIGWFLTGPYDFGIGGPGGWWFAPKPELHFGEDVLVPDLAGWRRERMPDLSAAYVPIAPVWLSEILSPSTSRLDRVRKLPLYAQVGVEWIWLVDPLQRTVEVYQRSGALWTLLGTHADSERVALPPFTEVELDLARFWIPAPAT